MTYEEPDRLAHRATVLVDGLGDGSIRPIAYSTSFVARLHRPDGSPLFPGALDWLRRHQWPDGSWGGAVPQPPDRLVSTLAALLALAGSAEDWARQAIESATGYLWRHAADWRDAGYETIAFELAVPHLLAEARRAGLRLPYAEFGDLDRMRADKLDRIPPDALRTRPTTLLYSLEVLGDVFAPGLAGRFRSGNGSLGNSPSATAAYWAATGDPAALRYLERLVDANPDGGVPEVWPVATFETAWAVYLLNRAKLLPVTAARPHLDRLHRILGDTGLAAIDPSFPVPDSDDTAMVYNALLDTGYPVAGLLDHLLVFESESCFRTFPYERVASVSANARVYEAFAHRPDRYPGQLAKILDYLRGERQDGGWWRDKWHASAYYATAQVVFALAGPAHRSGSADGVDGWLPPPEPLADTWRWLVGGQRADGSWGEPAGTAEETAYAVLALDALDHRHPVPPQVFELAGAYLREHVDDADPPELWIGKGLYTPDAVVRAAALAACAVAVRRTAAGHLVGSAE
ncbi:prenyltransferase/squalene oxidase repeat-containing protein [Plantactinospora endophytica]|uniref:Type B diterpene cyclase n=1 Tax=Plantactinospora endophytica TaxID=673535 RepID=A0ABQ4E0W3_9ACTN|nr:prenyltransferase/squalene oxidase repeat-containing protein [Plantactinospora endophytica]GIG88359.1 type B diterpene cyclase [Plantactinospora endophytica]